MHRRRSSRVARLPLFAILATCGCGFLFSKGPPPGHENMSAFYCTESDVGPVLDFVWAGLNVLGALAIAADPDAYSEAGYDPEATVAIGLAWGVVSTSAGVVGLGRSKRCREAKLALARRQAQMGPSAPGAVSAIVTVVVASPRDTISVGEQVQLIATAHHSSGVRVSSTFAWSSSNDAVAAVSISGLVTANAPGTVTIAANAANVVGTARLVIVARAP
jgi:hypothetical protein